MARNKIVQKGLSEAISRLLRHRGTVGRALVCLALASKFRLCAGRRCCEIKERKLYQCGSCRHHGFLDAGTIFHSTKLAIVWFLAIYLFTQTKKGISSELAAANPDLRRKSWPRSCWTAIGGPDKRIECLSPSAAVGLPARRPSSGGVEDHPPPQANAVKGFRKAEIAQPAQPLVPGTTVISWPCAAFEPCGLQTNQSLTGSGGPGQMGTCFRGNIKAGHLAVRPKCPSGESRMTVIRRSL